MGLLIMLPKEPVLRVTSFTQAPFSPSGEEAVGYSVGDLPMPVKANPALPEAQ